MTYKNDMTGIGVMDGWMMWGEYVVGDFKKKTKNILVGIRRTSLKKLSGYIIRFVNSPPTLVYVRNFNKYPTCPFCIIC